MVRTTLYLPIDLMVRVKIYAVNTGNTLSGLVKKVLEKKLKVKNKKPSIT